MKASIRKGLFAGAVFFPPWLLAVESIPKSADKSAAAEAKPYVLYMRTDVAVEQNKKLYPVKDVHGSMFIISVKGEQMSVPVERVVQMPDAQLELEQSTVQKPLGNEIESGLQSSPLPHCASPLQESPSAPGLLSGP